MKEDSLLYCDQGVLCVEQIQFMTVLFLERISLERAFLQGVRDGNIGVQDVADQ